MTTPGDLCFALKSAPPFITSAWMDQLLERARVAQGLSFIGEILGKGLPLESMSRGSHITSPEARALISTLAQPTAARGLSKLNSNEDPHGFRFCADETIAQLTMVDALTRLMGYCYADMIDEHLASLDISSLADLQANPDFVKKFLDMFLTEDFILDQIEQDVTVSNYNYSANLLFVANYLAHEATPRLHEHSKIWVQAFGKITRVNILAGFTKVGSANNDKLLSIVSIMSQALTISYGWRDSHDEEFLRPPSSGEILKPLAGMDVPEDVKTEIENHRAQNLNLGDWKAYGETMVTLWDDVAAKYEAGVRSYAIAQSAHYEPAPPSPYNGPTFGTITTTRGQRVKDWIQQVRSA